MPKGIRRHLPHHEIVTAQKRGWGETRNGALLTAAEAAGFKVMVTADKNLTYTQNMKGRKIALPGSDTPMRAGMNGRETKP